MKFLLHESACSHNKILQRAFGIKCIPCLGEREENGFDNFRGCEQVGPTAKVYFLNTLMSKIFNSSKAER
eukprot:TRINITY_DN4506_c0_g1_i1.p1 TRINITY_DN4506_c0_g1~~TRINITY_DN4506_c0_g1_i1.p1  ORF type:complete len:70 (-),score=5.22 TRINITY_DN4506_c0_g1_i1:84-293(-)